jgi:hypothetical protein
VLLVAGGAARLVRQPGAVGTLPAVVKNHVRNILEKLQLGASRPARAWQVGPLDAFIRPGDGGTAPPATSGNGP